jgi:hypothetical protein
LNREGSPRCAFGVVLLRHWITKQRHNPVARLLCDVAAHLCHGCRGSIQICADQIAPILCIECRRDACRTHEVAEHYRDMPTLADGFCDGRA